MKKYTGHLLAIVALMAAANVGWAQQPQATHAAHAAPSAPAVAAMPAPGDAMAWKLAGDDDGDDFATVTDDAGAGGDVEKRVVIRHMGGPGGEGGPGEPGEEGEDEAAPMMRMHGMGGPGMGGPGMGGRPGDILGPMFQQRLQLTPDQKTQLTALQKEVDSRLSAILTDSQRTQLKEMRDRGPGGFGPPGGRRGGGPPGGGRPPGGGGPPDRPE